MECQSNIQLPSLFLSWKLEMLQWTLLHQKNKHMTSFYTFVLESRDPPMNVTEPDKTNTSQLVSQHFHLYSTWDLLLTHSCTPRVPSISPIRILGQVSMFFCFNKQKNDAKVGWQEILKKYIKNARKLNIFEHRTCKACRSICISNKDTEDH